MITTASASVRPNYVELFYGLEPATWLAMIVGICALIDHFGEYTLKKKKNPEIEYDYAYLKTTGLAIIVMCVGALFTPVVELTELAVMNAILLGFGGNEYVARKTKVVK